MAESIKEEAKFKVGFLYIKVEITERERVILQMIIQYSQLEKRLRPMDLSQKVEEKSKPALRDM